jgi:hypothetical protein
MPYIPWEAGLQVGVGTRVLVQYDLEKHYDGLHEKLPYSSSNFVLPYGPRRLAPWPTCKSSLSSLSHIWA